MVARRWVAAHIRGNVGRIEPGAPLEEDLEVAGDAVEEDAGDTTESFHGDSKFRRFPKIGGRVEFGIRN
jgi:hypothetical protein